MNASKQKGTKAETAVVRFYEVNGYTARRNPPAGANDTGDVDVAEAHWLANEVKNHKAMALAQWVDEAEAEARNAKRDVGVVWHHRRGKGDPHDWYVTMSGRSFLELLNKTHERNMLRVGDPKRSSTLRTEDDAPSRQV